MKRILIFIILILLALLFILNWGQREEIISEVKSRFNKKQLQCDTKCTYQESKKWVQEKLNES